MTLRRSGLTTEVTESTEEEREFGGTLINQYSLRVLCELCGKSSANGRNTRRYDQNLMPYLSVSFVRTVWWSATICSRDCLARSSP